MGRRRVGVEVQGLNEGWIDMRISVVSGIAAKSWIARGAPERPPGEAGEGRRAARTSPATRLGYAFGLTRTPNTSSSLVEASLKRMAVSGSAVATPPGAR